MQNPSMAGHELLCLYLKSFYGLERCSPPTRTQGKPLPNLAQCAAEEDASLFDRHLQKCEAWLNPWDSSILPSLRLRNRGSEGRMLGAPGHA